MSRLGEFMGRGLTKASKCPSELTGACITILCAPHRPCVFLTLTGLAQRDTYLFVRHGALDASRYPGARHGSVAWIAPDKHVVVDEPEVHRHRGLVIEQDFEAP